MDVLFSPPVGDNFIAHAVNIERAAGDSTFERFTLRTATAAGTARATASPSTRSTSELHTGQWVGKTTSWVLSGRSESTTFTTCGITSPARRITTFIANAVQPQTFNFIGVMQRGVTDQYTRNLNRFKTRHRRNRAGTAN